MFADFIPHAKQLKLAGWVLEQGGPTPNTSDYLAVIKIQILHSAPNSLDLSTIENVRQIFKLEIEKQNHEFR